MSIGIVYWAKKKKFISGNYLLEKTPVYVSWNYLFGKNTVYINGNHLLEKNPVYVSGNHILCQKKLVYVSGNYLLGKTLFISVGIIYLGKSCLCQWATAVTTNCLLYCGNVDTPAQKAQTSRANHTVDCFWTQREREHCGHGVWGPSGSRQGFQAVSTHTLILGVWQNLADTTYAWC